MRLASFWDRVFGSTIVMLLVFGVFIWTIYAWSQGDLHWVFILVVGLVMTRINAASNRVKADTQWAETKRGGILTRRARSPHNGVGLWSGIVFVIGHPAVSIPAIGVCAFAIVSYWYSTPAAQAQTRTATIAAAGVMAVCALLFWLRLRRTRKGHGSLARHAGLTTDQFMKEAIVQIEVPRLGPVAPVETAMTRLSPPLQQLIERGRRAALDGRSGPPGKLRQ